MYERNAIVLERYFNQMFGYNMKNNVKTNFKDYCELIECLEKYKNISEDEENIMQEYDSIANRIREVQKKQEMLNKRNAKYQKDREDVFQNIDDNSDAIQKKFDTINENIQNINEQIKENQKEFIDVVAAFNEKTSIRTSCGRSRRDIEGDYNKQLNKTLDDYQDIDLNIEKRAKQFIDMQTDGIEQELNEKIQKNGEKEKIPFNTDVISKAIMLSVDIQKRETEIYAWIYDKTNKLFTEIKNNSIKTEKHKKNIKDAKSKLEFVGALKEYLVQFLDNERLTAVNGIEEHNKLMKEACKNLEEDLTQINNLYTLLLKEIAKKATKKMYGELYNIEYLKSLEEKTEEFDNEIKKLNLPVTIINPNYWRIEGMKKIYEVFYKTVTEQYGKDLSEYIPITEIEEENEDFDDDWDDEEIKESQPEEKKNNNEKLDIDRKIDMILGFEKKENFKDDEEDDWDDEEDMEEDEDDIHYDIWGNNLKEKKSDKELDEEEDFDDDWEDDDDEDWDDEEDDDNWDDEEDDDDWDDDEEDDDWEDEKEEKINKEEEEKITQKKKTEEDWENEYVKIEKPKKKKGFFDKFKR